jgi:hypothetical protein
MQNRPGIVNRRFLFFAAESGCFLRVRRKDLRDAPHRLRDALHRLRDAGFSAGL